MKSPAREPSGRQLGALWRRHDAAWRNPAAVASQWPDLKAVDADLLVYRATQHWWEILAATQSTLLVTREYEHLVIAMTVEEGRPLVSWWQLPHPSGLAVDTARATVFVASSRNPNLVFDFTPAASHSDHRYETRTARHAEPHSSWLLPRRIRFYPGRFYMHDLSMLDGGLYVSSVGQNAILRLDEAGGFERVWWPRCVEKRGEPVFERNYIQLNSIAAGPSIAQSYFSASADKMSARRPGQRNFPVDRRGVIFSGATREPAVRGLTRPHSARLHRQRLYVDDSGYGDFVTVAGSEISRVARLPGWTRGLAFHGHTAFVGSSRVIPRFQQYAPGLEVAKSTCGLHAVDLESGQVLASLTWPYGNQIFAIELAPKSMTLGFPMRRSGVTGLKQLQDIFYNQGFER